MNDISRRREAYKMRREQKALVKLEAAREVERLATEMLDRIARGESKPPSDSARRKYIAAKGEPRSRKDGQVFRSHEGR